MHGACAVIARAHQPGGHFGGRREHQQRPSPELRAEDALDADVGEHTVDGLRGTVGREWTAVNEKPAGAGLGS